MQPTFAPRFANGANREACPPTLCRRSAKAVTWNASPPNAGRAKLRTCPVTHDSESRARRSLSLAGRTCLRQFYVPYRQVKHWSWETYWLAGGVFSWIIAPWTIAFFRTNDLFAVLARDFAARSVLAVFLRLLWGVGGLTFGLTMRYLGLSLGMAIVLGLCAAFGTLMPPLFAGEFASKVLGTTSGRIILAGVAVCMIGHCGRGNGRYRQRTRHEPEQRRGP